MSISATQGFDGSEIIDRIVQHVGNDTDKFKSFVAKTLPFGIQRYFKVHNWSFGFKYNLALSVVAGTSEYDLSVANIGFKMSTDSVQTIFSENDKRVVRKIDLTSYRTDPYNFNSGSTAAAGITNWAEIGENRILIGPQNVVDQTLRIDGYIVPSNFEAAAALYDIDTNPTAFDGVYPEVPFEYQEAMIEYITALVLDRENDDRAENKKVFALSLVNSDIEHDLRRAGDQSDVRFKTLEELYGHGYY